jgi:hypothetical protein
MADINPCDDARRATVKRLAEKYPALKWRVQLSIPSNLDATFPDADRREFFLLDHDEALWSLPAAPPAPAPEPPPVKTVQLRVVYNISVRAGPGQTYAVLGSVPAGTVATFTDESAADADYTWRRLADGFEGRTAWIAARNLKEGRDLLVNP